MKDLQDLATKKTETSKRCLKRKVEMNNENTKKRYISKQKETARRYNDLIWSEIAIKCSLNNPNKRATKFKKKPIYSAQIMTYSTSGIKKNKFAQFNKGIYGSRKGLLQQ